MASTNTLPGVKAEILDGGLRPRSIPVQPKIMLIGATNNPDISPGEPLRIDSDDDAILFDNKYASDGVTLDPNGPLSKPSELTLAIAEAFGGGADHVEVYPLPDPTGTSLLLEPNPTNARRYAALDEAYKLLRFAPLDIVVPVGATIDATGLLATQNFAYQLGDFCHQTTINESSCIGVIGTTPPVAGENIPTLAEQESWVAGLESFDLSAVLGASFTIGDGITDVGGDGIPDTYAFWSTQDSSIPTGAPPRFNGKVEEDRRKNPIDLGRYLSVVPEHVRFLNEEAARHRPNLGFYHNSAAVAYAGMIAATPSWIGTTNQNIRGASPIRPLAPSQVERLASKRYVSFMLRAGGFVVADGVTWAHKVSDAIRSDFTQLTTIRITMDAVAFVRSRCQRYLGQPNNASVRSAIAADVDESLQKLQTLGALQDFEFRLAITPAQMVLGKMAIEMKLVPAFEIREITVVAGLSASLTV
jgi:hypothetical protein